MLFRRLIAGFLLTTAAIVPGHATEATASFTLPNGLQVVVLPDHRLPVVTHVVYFRAGSADDPAGQTGIAHFLEHLMFKGTKRFPTGQYDLIVTRTGGTNNAFTSNDKTYYYEQFLKDGLGRIMDLNADRMARLAFAPIEAQHELKVVIEERRSYDNDPESVLAEKVGRALYGAGPYGHPVLGEAAETAALTLSAALGFHDRFYVPGNAIVIVAGDVEPEAVLRLAQSTYGRLATGPALPTRAWSAAPATCANGRIEERHERVPRDKLSLYFVTPGAKRLDAKTAAALQLLADILQDESGSPLWQDLVARAGIASDVSAGYDMRLASGEFSIGAQAEAGIEAKQLEIALLTSLNRLRRTGVNAVALAGAKRRWLAGRLLSADDQLGQATRYGEQLALGRTLNQIEGEPQAIAAVTLSDVNAAIGRFLGERCAVSALLEATGAPVGDSAPVPTHPTNTVH